MKNSATLALAAALALSGATAATAAEMSKNAAKSTGMTTGMSTAGRTASDTLSLSSTQQKSIWSDVSHHATNQSAPLGFKAAVGTALPDSVAMYPLPQKAERDVPAVKPYRYAMLQDKVLIVNPSDRKIAEVVAR